MTLIRTLRRSTADIALEASDGYLATCLGKRFGKRNGGLAVHKLA